MFSSYSWFGNDLQVPESNSIALPDVLIKIYAAKLCFVAAASSAGGGGGVGWDPVSWALLVHWFTPKMLLKTQAL